VPNWSFPADEVPVDAGSLVLVVGQRRRDNSVDASRIEIAPPFADALRNLCRNTLALTGTRDEVQFDTDVRVLPREAFMSVETGGAETDSALVNTLRQASALQAVGARDLADSRSTFYAVVLEEPPDGWCAFVRANDPRQAVKGGRIIGRFDQTLQPIPVPVFVFEEYFDLILLLEGTAVLRFGAFEALFRDVALMTDRIPTWVGTLTSALPLDPAAAKWLEERAAKSGPVAEKVRSIHERGHLAGKTLSAQKLRSEFKRLDLDPGEFIRDGKVFIGMSNVKNLLDVLNEDLFAGGLSSIDYRAGSKSKRA
jgi:hypothetical protein